MRTSFIQTQAVETKKTRKGLPIAVAVSSLLFFQGTISAQSQVYDNFDGSKSLYYSSKSGVLDTAAKNPAPDKVNGSAKCALYVRNASKKFDNIKMVPSAKLSDVSPFATYVGIPPQLKMKVYTTAPVGTLVEILLGSKGRNNEYPEGTNSQYQAYTTVSGKWEELTFKFSQIPEGSQTTTTQVDQITLLFYPNSSNSDTYYFDEITGPSLAAGTGTGAGTGAGTGSGTTTNKNEKK